MEQQSDERLMAGMMAGEAAALAALVERHHSPLLGYLYRLVNGDRPLAEDLCQETFLRLMQQRSYQYGRPFKPWLYAIATNLARDYYKSAAVSHALRQSETEAAIQEPHDTAPGPEAAALAAEQGREIAAALGRLSEKYRVALLLRFYNGFSLQEIADTLHIQLGTVKSRLSVGTHRLREMLMPVRSGGA
jgi:RNA polymerase sigma-70 factor (ECF subfamily)